MKFLEQLLSLFLQVGIIGAVCTALVFLAKLLVDRLFKRDLAEHKAKLDEGLERAKNDLRKESELGLEIKKSELKLAADQAIEHFRHQLKIEGTNRERAVLLLADKRAQVVAELYAKLASLQYFAGLIYSSVPGMGVVSDRPRLADGITDEAVDKFFDEFHDLEDLHSKYDIYLPDAISEQMITLVATIKGVVGSSILADMRHRKNESSFLEPTIRAMAQVPAMKSTLKAELQRLISAAEAT